MNRNVVSGIVVVAVLAACAIGWLVLPALEDPRLVVDAEASRHVERARRLLHRYSVTLTHTGLLRDQLFENDVDIDVEDPEALEEAAADEYQEEHETAWEAYQPTDWRQGPQAARAGYGNIARQIREGIEGRIALVEANPEYLKEALEAVGEALNVSHGDVTARTHAEATRLKGVIQFHMGLAEWMRADAIRRQADPYRRELIAYATEIAGLQSAQDLVANSGLDGRIRDLQAKIAENEVTLGQRQKTLTELEDIIAGINTRLAVAQAMADRARVAMDELGAAGIDLSDPHGGEAFGSAFTAQNRAYRQALREIQSLRAGSIPDAQLERPGDYLDADYVERGSRTDLTFKHGLVHFENERRVLAAIIEVEGRAIGDLQSAITRLEGMKATFQTEQDRAAKQIPDAVATAAETFEELNGIDSEALEAEEEALRLLDQSARASKQAAGYAANDLSEARDRAGALSSTARGQSALAKREQDRWIGGHIAAQTADARLARAWVYYQQYEAYSRTAEVLAQVGGPLELEEADVEDERAKATEAHDAGVEEISLAVIELQRAHRDADRHWTIVAQEAGAAYLMALFGHPSYVDEAIEAYRSAVQDREDEASARPFVNRLDRLENM